MLLALNVTAKSQTYLYSGPVSGYGEVGLNPGGGYVGQTGFFFGNLNETIYYDSSANTLRTVGSVSINPGGGFFNIQQRFGSVLGSANVTVGDGESFAFDTTWILSGPTFCGNLAVPVSCSGNFDGTPFSGNYQIHLPIFAQIISADENSLTFNQFDMGAVHGEAVMCVNGCQLYSGAGGDNTIHWSWRMNSVTAAVVPEPGSFSLVTLGLIALGFFRRC